jgi:hypothetical protein
MSIPMKCRLARGLALAAVLIAPGCKSSQLQTARVISEDRNMVMIAIPENTDPLLKKAKKLAESKLGRDIVFVEGKEITTKDSRDEKKKEGKIIGRGVVHTDVVFRREYQVTFKSKKTAGG